VRTAESGRFAFFDVDGPEFVLDKEGWRRRPTLLVIPAGPGFSHKTLRPWLTDLAPLVRLTHVDLPGTGHASVEPDSDYTFPALIEDLDEVRVRVGADRPVILGHGWGAALAVEYALTHPGNVAALVLVSPLRCFGVEGQDTAAQSRQVERTDPSLGKRFATDVRPPFEAAIAGAGPWETVESNSWWSEMILTQFSRSPPPSWFASLARERWGLRAYATYKGAAMFRPNDPMVSYDLARRSAGLDAALPVLIVSSNHDANYVAKAATHAIPLHAAMPASELLLGDDTGHFPFVERPGEFSAAGCDFLVRKAVCTSATAS